MRSRAIAAWERPSEPGRDPNLLVRGSSLDGTIPSELGNATLLRSLKLNSNSLSGSIPSQLGSLQQLDTLDLYENGLTGDMPASLGGLRNIRLFYLPNEQLKPLRLRYCQQRMPAVGKYSYRIVREEYHQMAASICPDPMDTETAFGALSGDV